MTVPPLSMSIRLPRALSVPELTTVPVRPAAAGEHRQGGVGGNRGHPAQVEGAGSGQRAAHNHRASEPETMVSPWIVSTVPLTVWISALAPLVAKFPPDSVVPLSCSVAPLAVALTANVPALTTAPLPVR
jgi:hypothetical protein